MTISTTLFKAILAMDSYNRSYGEGINGLSSAEGTKIGNATIGKDSSILKAVDGTRLDIPAGFYAISYALASGEEVISYRGTNADNIVNFLNDAIFGYGVGAGTPAGVQAVLAVKFYNAVKAANPNAAISLTGHSLGGGLAGYVGGFYGKSVMMFDNMTYQNSVVNGYKQALNAYKESLPSFTGTKTATNSDIVDLWGGVYGNNVPTTPVYTGSAYYVQGELLEGLLPARVSQSISPTKISVTSNLAPVDLHSQALLITLMFAKDNAFIDWQNNSATFIDSLFNAKVAAALGLQDNVNGVYGAAQKMLTAIAYSAIDEGTRVFGDTGIRALFNDANELGKVLKFADVSSSIKDNASAISDIFTQFAGQMAMGKVMQTDADAVANNVLGGVITLSPDTNTMKIDFNSALWNVGKVTAQATNVIIGKNEYDELLIINASNLQIFQSPQPRIETAFANDNFVYMVNENAMVA